MMMPKDDLPRFNPPGNGSSQRANGSPTPFSEATRKVVPPGLIEELVATVEKADSVTPPEDIQALLRATSEEADASPEPEPGDASRRAARRLFANAVVHLHSVYPEASTIELAAMANALTELATGHGVELELAIPPELFQNARLALAAGVRGAAAIQDSTTALRTAVAVMAQGVVGRKR